jgi:hypothetical protein
VADPNSQFRQKTVSRWPVLIVLLLLLMFSAVFLIEFAGLSDPGSAIPEDDLTAGSYMERVEDLLADADPSSAPDVIFSAEYGCASCHLSSINLAPDFAQLPKVASTRRPPLQPAAYLYESIIYPAAFEVEGAWRANMPINFDERLTDQQLGDVIAWLLMPADERPLESAATP